ncbi:MAG: radical SAM protein [Thermoplasmata archaeon]
MEIRVAIGTAMALGLRKGTMSSQPVTAHLLTPGRCIYDCAYCTKARTSRSPQDFMCRITWPRYPESEVWRALGEEGSRFKRICIQVVNQAGCIATVRKWLVEIRNLCDLPISVEIRTGDSRVVGDLLLNGADRIGLPLDVASERLYPRMRGGDLHEALGFLESASQSFPGRTSTHIIVGLGESDRELMRVARRILRRGVPLALFAFTPCKGTKLERRAPPTLERYRKIQIATQLIAGDPNVTFEYDRAGGLVLPTFDRDELLSILGKALLTRGCDGCNRPYYNERPGCPPYNYPEEPDEERVRREMQAVVR